MKVSTDKFMSRRSNESNCSFFGNDGKSSWVSLKEKHGKINEQFSDLKHNYSQIISFIAILAKYSCPHKVLD